MDEIMDQSRQYAGVDVPKPAFKLTYENKDITKDISPMLVSLSYTDALENESDSIDITVENASGKWIDDWYPQLGAKLTLSMGYQDSPLTPCGTFEIDEISIECPPSTVRIRALAATVSKQQRTRKARGYDNMTLRAIIHDVAKRNKLSVKGDIEEIEIRRVTQTHERDLAFLKRLANEYGYAVNVKGDMLLCYKMAGLRQAPVTLSIDLSQPRQVISYRFTDKIKDVVKGATVKHHNRKQRKTVEAEYQYQGEHKTAADEVKLVYYTDNEQQANAKSMAAVDKKNDDKTTGSLSLAGNPKLRAGLTVDLLGIGQHLSGKWLISSSKHNMDRSSGYKTDIDVKKVDKS